MCVAMGSHQRGVYKTQAALGPAVGLLPYVLALLDGWQVGVSEAPLAV